MPISKKYLGKYFILLDGRDFYGQWIGSEQSLPAKDSHEDGAGVYYYGPDDATAFESLRCFGQSNVPNGKLSDRYSKMC